MIYILLVHIWFSVWILRSIEDQRSRGQRVNDLEGSRTCQIGNKKHRLQNTAFIGGFCMHLVRDACLFDFDDCNEMTIEKEIGVCHYRVIHLWYSSDYKCIDYIPTSTCEYTVV